MYKVTNLAVIRERGRERERDRERKRERKRERERELSEIDIVHTDLYAL